MQDCKLTFADIHEAIYFANSNYYDSRWYNSDNVFVASLSTMTLFGGIYNFIKPSSRDFETLRKSIDIIAKDRNKTDYEKNFDSQVMVYEYLTSGAGENNQYSHKFYLANYLCLTGNLYRYANTSESELVENTIKQFEGLTSIQQHLKNKNQEQTPSLEINSTFDFVTSENYSHYNELYLVVDGNRIMK